MSDGLHTSIWFSDSDDLIHLFACPCGSMESGQRRAFERMMPFSVETVSTGSPCTCHLRTLTGSAITFETDAPSECGTASAASCVRHPSAIVRR